MLNHNYNLGTMKHLHYNTRLFLVVGVFKNY